MIMIVRNQSIVKKFLNNFRESYNEFFENKDFLKKIGDQWSVIVGFTKSFYPKKVYEQFDGYTYLTVELEEKILFSYYGKEKFGKELKGDPYLISRYYAQEARKDEEIVKKVLKNREDFINYINELNGEKIS